MTSRTIIPQTIPNQHISRPNFTRGTMGKDIGHSSNNLDGRVIDRKQHDKIAHYSKNAHFTFSVNGMCSHNSYFAKFLLPFHSFSML